MEAIATLKDSTVSVILQPTIDAFSELLEKNRKSIEAVPLRTFAFGPSERNKLDVYYPTSTDSAEAPIVFFIYGGGFVAGARAYPPPSLVHANVGAFFARRGFIVAIPDYSLAPAATYPLPAQEVRDAIVWLTRHAADEARAVPGAPAPDTTAVHVLGHSAGAAHAWTAFVEPTLADGDAGRALRASTRTLALSGMPARGWPASAVYYGSEEAYERLQPLSLLEQAAPDLLHSLPRIVVVKAEHEPEKLHSFITEFEERLDERMGQVGGGGADRRGKASVIVGAGHNHISISMALSSGEGEQWAEELVRVFQGA